MILDTVPSSREDQASSFANTEKKNPFRAVSVLMRKGMSHTAISASDPFDLAK